MAGQLNPFQLRAPQTSVSAADLLRNQALLGSQLKEATTGFKQFGQQQNTNDLNDLIARGGLEGMSTDQAQQAIAQLGLTGGVTKDMNTFMEQGHQGRQQEDRQRAAVDAANELFGRQQEMETTKQGNKKELAQFREDIATGTLVPVKGAAGLFMNNKSGKLVQAPVDETASKTELSKPTGYVKAALNYATDNSKKVINEARARDSRFNAEPVVTGRDKYGNDKYSKTSFLYMYKGTRYDTPESLAEELAREDAGKEQPATNTAEDGAIPSETGVDKSRLTKSLFGELDPYKEQGGTKQIFAPSGVAQDSGTTPTQEGLNFLQNLQIGGNSGQTKTNANDLIANSTVNGKDASRYEGLAREAGIPTEKMDKIMDKLIEIESTGKGYTAQNPKSSAYGKYQFIEKTARELAGKLGIPFNEWKKPENQERMFQEFTRQNIRGLKQAGLEPNAFNIYGAHQQGVAGLKDILSNDPARYSKRAGNMIKNLGSDYKEGMTLKQIREKWLSKYTKKTR